MDEFKQMQLLRPVIEANRRELRMLEPEIVRLRNEVVQAGRTGNAKLLYKLGVGRLQDLTQRATELRQELAQQEMELSNLLRNRLMAADSDTLFNQMIED